jgi:hypothetical protein
VCGGEAVLHASPRLLRTRDTRRSGTSTSTAHREKQDRGADVCVLMLYVCVWSGHEERSVGLMQALLDLTLTPTTHTQVHTQHHHISPGLQVMEALSEAFSL